MCLQLIFNSRKGKRLRYEALDVTQAPHLPPIRRGVTEEEVLIGCIMTDIPWLNQQDKHDNNIQETARRLPHADIRGPTTPVVT